jgi:type VI protein secretion system component VasF
MSPKQRRMLPWVVVLVLAVVVLGYLIIALSVSTSGVLQPSRTPSHAPLGRPAKH